MIKITALFQFIRSCGNTMRRIAVIGVFAIANLVTPVHAQQSPRFTLPYLGGNLGRAEVRDASGYKSSGSTNGYAGFYLVDNFSVELWTAYLGQFDIKNLSKTYSEAAGAGVTAAYRIDMGKVFALPPSVGLFYSRTKIVFEGNKIGEDTGADLMLGLSGVFTINEHILVNLNSQLFKNVSGSDIWVLSVGAGYQF